MTFEYMVFETPVATPEEAAQSINELSRKITTFLDILGGDHVKYAHDTVQNGDCERKYIEPGMYPTTYTEYVSSDGSAEYKINRHYNQTDDTGTKEWSWRQGGYTIDYHGEMEVAGESFLTISKPSEVVAFAITETTNIESRIASHVTQEKPRHSTILRQICRSLLGRL